MRQAQNRWTNYLLLYWGSDKKVSFIEAQDANIGDVRI
jgi:hypothetical protein